jgi:hypothetical protein
MFLDGAGDRHGITIWLSPASLAKNFFLTAILFHTNAIYEKKGT